MPKHTTVIELMEETVEYLRAKGCNVCPGIIIGKRGTSQKTIKAKEISGGFLLTAKDGAGVQQIRVYGGKGIDLSKLIAGIIEKSNR